MRNTVAILVTATGLLLMLGLVALFSATAEQPTLQRLSQHGHSIELGLLCGAAMAFFDYSLLRKWRIPIFLLGISCALLLAVFIPGIGTARNGASRWLMGGQPSELVKLALIIYLADYGATHQTRMNERRIGFTRPLFVAAPLLILIFLEPDWGCACLMALVTGAILAVAGTGWLYLTGAAMIGSLALIGLLAVDPVHRIRVLAFLDLEKYKNGIGWQVWASVHAMAHGGWLGTSFGEGSFKNGFVPEQQTDFVLSLIGEEAGLLGVWLVLALFATIVICGSRIAWRTTDAFGKLLAFGITFLIGAQALINVCVVTGCLPNKGIALPFVSYGGSNSVAMLSGVGLLMSIARSSD